MVGRRDVGALCDQLAVDAVDGYLCSPFARSGEACYLWVLPAGGPYDGHLRFAPDPPAPAWQLVEPRAERGFTERLQLLHRVRQLVRHLPVIRSDG